MELVSQSNSPQQFVFDDTCAVRAINRDGDLWFVASDVCAALAVGNHRDALSRLDEDEKGVVLIDTLGGSQQTSAVNEPGLYALVLSSRKPGAKAFKRWITHEVIPALRTKGQYSIRPLTPAEQALAHAELLVAHERKLTAIQEAQIVLDQRLADIEVRQTSIERGTEYFTVMAFASRCGLRVDNTKAKQVGKYAARYSRKHGYPIGEAPDTRYGHVNTYHETVLRAVLGIAE